MADENGSTSDVLVDAAHLSELLTRLQDRKAAVEKECARLPAAPKGKDIFHLCRGFERAFSHVVEAEEAVLQSTDYAATIRRTFQYDGLQGAVESLPLEKRFKLASVKDVVRESDGYEGHLVSPEMGLRRMVDETLGLVLDPVNTAVRRVHQVLIDAAREASKKASLMTDSTQLDPTKESLKLPAFESVAMMAVTKALELWRDEALQVARTIVTMEQTYVTAAFFRHLTVERHARRIASMYDEGHQQLVEGDGVAAEGEGSDSDDETETASELDSYAANAAPKREEKPREASPPAQRKAGGDTGDLKTGYLEKRIGEKSGRQNLPESLKWQKRYFVLAEPKGMLYYFKSVDDPPHYKGLINMREAKVEDVDVDGLPKSANKSKYDLDGGGGQVSLLIRLSHKNPSKPLVKNHQSIVLRAESAPEKYDWLARLKFASERSTTANQVRAYDSNQLLEGASKGTDELGMLGKMPEPPKESKKDRSKQKVDSKAPGAAQQAIYGGTPRTDAIATAGLGSAMTFDEDASIGPEPILFRRNFMGMPNPGGTQDPHVFDEFLTQLGEDVAAYVRTVCHTIVLTVPKAIIHCQVKRAQTHLLEHLYSHVTSLSSAEGGDNLLDEEPEIMQRRAAGQKSLQEMKEAIRALTQLQETSNADKVPVAAAILELAGSQQMVPERLRSTGSGRYGSYTPAPLQGTYGSENGNYRTSSGAPPRRSTSNSSSRSVPQAPPPQRPAPPMSARPTGPPDLSAPSPMPRRRPPPAPPGQGPPSAR